MFKKEGADDEDIDEKFKFEGIDEEEPLPPEKVRPDEGQDDRDPYYKMYSLKKPSELIPAKADTEEDEV